MKKYDYILICSFLIISVILFSIYYINKKPGMYVTVNTDGSIYTCLPLNKDTLSEYHKPATITILYV